MRTYAYHVKHKNGWGTGFGPRPTHCHKCAAELPETTGTGDTGYGCGKPEPMASREQYAASVAAGDERRDFQSWRQSIMNDAGLPQVQLKPGESYERSPAFCYQCCADDERARMIETGRAMLYLTRMLRPEFVGYWREWQLTDWAGELSFPVTSISKGRHNMAGTRYDVTFTGPDGKPWRGTQYGENTQICHCRRLGK